MRMPGVGLFVAAMLVAGCGLAERAGADPVIDTWPVGGPATCEERCLPAIEAATDAFEAREPGHAAIVKVTLHSFGREVDASGRPILRVISGGGTWVAVFELGDGSVRAIGVGYPGVSREPVTFDYYHPG
jgi:hypothetical protein